MYMSVQERHDFGRALRSVVRTCARAYREWMSRFAATRELDVWYAHTAIDEALEAQDLITPESLQTRQGSGRDDNT